MKKIKWTYDTCKKEASKYKTRSEFAMKSKGAYGVSNKKKWLNDFFPKKEITYEICKKEASKYRTRSEFAIYSATIFNVAKKNNWIEKFFGKSKFNKNGYWDYEMCKKESLKYKSRVEFFKKNSTAYYKSLRKGWIDDFIWLKTPTINENLPTSNINLIYAYESEKYKTVYVGRTNNIKRRHNQHNRIDYKSKKYDKLKSFFININEPLPYPKILEENLTYEESQICEEKWLKYYIDNKWNILNISKVGLNSSSLGRTYIKWTYEKTLNESKKYKTKMDFKKNANGAYWASIKHNWINDFTWLIEIKKPNGYWNSYELCKIESEKYTKKSDFKKYSGSAYQASLKNNWLNDFFPK